MARIAKAICPHCGVVLKQDKCYETSFQSGYITSYLAGHCPRCDRDFQWVEVYDYAGVEDLEEVRYNE